MKNRKGLAAVAACAMLACGSLAMAESPKSALTLERPIMAQANAPRTPMMSLLDKAGAGSALDNAGITVGGHVEVSWTDNFSDPAGNINVGRVFDFEHDDHTFNQLDLYVDKGVKASGSNFDLGGRMEWIWGGDARLIHANGVFDHYGFPIFQGSPGTGDGPDEQFDPVQFYLQANLPVGNGLIVTFGKFVTLLGYETINPTTNPLYSHSYSFGYGIPFTHFGVMAKYGLTDNITASVAVVRGWEQAFEDNNDSHAYLGQIAYTSDNMDAYFNFITGPEQEDNEHDWRTVLNAVLVYRASDQLTLVADGVYGIESAAASNGDDAHWCGLAGYGIYKFSDMFSFVGRLEYFNDQDGSRGLGATVYEATVGVNIHPLPGDEWGKGLVVRPELRYDWANHDIFDGGTDESQVTFGVDAIYAF